MHKLGILDSVGITGKTPGHTVKLPTAVTHVYIDAEKKRCYELASKDDPLLSTLADTIITGWPDDIKDIPKAL